MAKFSAVIPLMHKECRLFQNVPILLDESTSVRSLRNEHLGAILAKSRKFGEQISPQTKCIIIERSDAPPDGQHIEQAALCSAFALNVFARSGSLSYGQAFLIRHIRSHTVLDVYDLASPYHGNFDKFAIDSSTTPGAVKTLFGSTAKALFADPKFSISIRRFNAALSRSAPEDRIIDLVICLESIFNSQIEISFRFALYNSILSEVDLSKRYGVFKTLRNLYKRRSDIVHGSKALDTVWLNTHWEAIVRIAKLSLMTKIEFLSNHAPADWQNHLDMLALGVK